MYEESSSWNDKGSIAFCVISIVFTAYTFPLTRAAWDELNSDAPSSVILLLLILMVANFFYSHKKFGEITPIGIGLTYIIFGVLSGPVYYLFPNTAF